MEFIINEEELEALCGLPHIQQLAYIRGIRPYMDVTTGIVGIKRGISYQSISEQLYIEPHQGIKSESYSRAQIRRALASLERVNLITLQSQGMRLILKCQLASLGYFVRNKVVTKPSQQAVLSKSHYNHENKSHLEQSPENAGTVKTPKADTPLREVNIIYLLSQFEQFWDLYPLKKSKQKAWEAFQVLNPSAKLQAQIHSALNQQIQMYQQQQSQGLWVAAWKFPANWLAQQCWEDEIQIDVNQETNNAVLKTNHKKQPSTDSFWESCKSGIEEQADGNIIELSSYRGTSQAY